MSARPSRRWMFVMLGILLGPTLAISQTLPADPEGAALIREARERIAAYHDGAPPAHDVLRVVYFYPSDGAPLRDYQERMDRILSDVSDFYRTGLERFGVTNQGLPLEKRDGHLLLHEVKGKRPFAGYRHESGDVTAAEIREALTGEFDTQREALLVLCALCRQEQDGRYIFTAPYYGGGSQARGICHAADCELLDPALLKDTARKIVYTEHYYPRVDQSVAKFNSMYLGGIAHELGHGLGLPHDSGGNEEKGFGVSLMGGGNLTYREELWGGGPPTYLSRASALQLVSHPFFTGSNRGRWDAVDPKLSDLDFSAEGPVLRITGKASGRIPAYAEIAYVWSAKLPTDHSAITFPVVLKDGAFSLNVTGLQPGEYRLKLSTLFVNGATANHEFRFGFDKDGKPDVLAVNSATIVGRAEDAVMNHQPNARALVSDQAIAAAPDPETKRRLQILHAVLDPAPLVDLSTVEGASVYLSDAASTEAKVGWGEVARNYYWFDDSIHDGVFLSLGGQVYEKGLYAHASSRYVFPVAEKWKRFRTTVGLRDGAAAQGSAIFVVRGDGKELYRSPILRAGAQKEIDLDISGVKELELLTDGGEGHNHNCWSIWAAPLVSR